MPLMFSKQCKQFTNKLCTVNGKDILMFSVASLFQRHKFWIMPTYDVLSCSPHHSSFLRNFKLLFITPTSWFITNKAQNRLTTRYYLALPLAFLLCIIPRPAVYHRLQPPDSSHLVSRVWQHWDEQNRILNTRIVELALCLNTDKAASTNSTSAGL